MVNFTRYMHTILCLPAALIFLFISGLLFGIDNSFQVDEYQSVLQRGRDCLASQQWDTAIEEYRKALGIKESAEAYGGIARAYFKKALTRYRQILVWRVGQQLQFLHEAETSYRKAAELEPENIVWHYELAELCIHNKHESDLQSAVELLEGIRRKNPSFRDILYLLARSYDLQKKNEKADELYRAAFGEKTDTMTLLRRSSAAARKNDIQNAENFYLQAIESLNDSTAHYMLDYVGMVFSAQNSIDWEKTGSRKDFLRQFWLLQDPTPGTPENERIQEHLRRMAYAYEHLTSPHSPESYDARGLVYIRYGKPHYRYQLTGGIHLREPEVYANESWHYNYGMGTWKDGVIFDFALIPGSGFMQIQEFSEAIAGQPAWSFLLGLFQARADINKAFYRKIAHESDNEEMFYSNVGEYVEKKSLCYKHLPSSIYLYENSSIKTLPLQMAYASFRGGQGMTRHEIYYSLPLNSLTFPDGTDGKTKSIVEELIVRRTREEAILNKRRKINFRFDQNRLLRDEWYIGKIYFDLPPQSNPLAAALLLEDPDDKSMSTVTFRLPEKNYSRDIFMISDLILSYSITPSVTPDRFTRSDIRIIPHTSHIFSKRLPVFIYYELYNLCPDTNNKNSYIAHIIFQKDIPEAIDGFEFFAANGTPFLPAGKESKNAHLSLKHEKHGTGKQEAAYIAVDLAALDPGTYTMMFYVTDVQSKQHASSSRNISIIQ